MNNLVKLTILAGLILLSTRMFSLDRPIRFTWQGQQVAESGEVQLILNAFTTGKLSHISSEERALIPDPIEAAILTTISELGLKGEDLWYINSQYQLLVNNRPYELGDNNITAISSPEINKGGLYSSSFDTGYFIASDPSRFGHIHVSNNPIESIIGNKRDFQVSLDATLIDGTVAKLSFVDPF